MIVRIWHGVTPAAKSDAYFDYLRVTGVSDYRATETGACTSCAGSRATGHIF
jgi:hypothetical protein